MTLKICATSDWHGHLVEIEEPADVGLLCGDIEPDFRDPLDQIDWITHILVPHLQMQPVNRWLYIAGNHSFGLQHYWQTLWLPDNITYLQEDTVVIDGVKFYGSPWSPQYGQWAFMQQDIFLKQKFDLIPDDVDVILSHSPPKGYRDPGYQADNVGSVSLLERIKKLSGLKYVAVGHLHSGYGKEMMSNGTCIINCSICDERYEPVNAPIYFEV